MSGCMKRVAVASNLKASRLPDNCGGRFVIGCEIKAGVVSLDKAALPCIQSHSRCIITEAANSRQRLFTELFFLLSFLNLTFYCFEYKMKSMLSLCALAVLLVCVNSKKNPPKVQVYSRNPGKYGEPNKLICHVSEFHPPDISIFLLKNGVEMPGAEQTDLAFEKSWQFHLTKSVVFTPQKGEEYTCQVKHHGKVHDYLWEPKM